MVTENTTSLSSKKKKSRKLRKKTEFQEVMKQGMLHIHNAVTAFSALQWWNYLGQKKKNKMNEWQDRFPEHSGLHNTWQRALTETWTFIPTLLSTLLYMHTGLENTEFSWSSTCWSPEFKSPLLFNKIYHSEFLKPCSWQTAWKTYQDFLLSQHTTKHTSSLAYWNCPVWFLQILYFDV